MKKSKVKKMSNNDNINLSNLLYEKLVELDGDKFDNQCIHVTDLLKNEYEDKQEQSALIRGKLYHYAIESLLTELHMERKVTVLEKEKTRELDYVVKGKKFHLCFTPDVILMMNNKTILVEIKSTVKSRDYAILQTSIYKYLLENFFNRKIDQCLLLTGDLQTYKLMCDSEIGKQLLEYRLGNSLLLFM